MTKETLAVQIPDVSMSERKLAMAMHIASIFAPLWFPFVVWAGAKATSTPFLKAHARQAAFEGIVWKAILLVLMIGSITWTIIRLFQHLSTNFQQFEWSEVGIRLLISVAIFGTLAIFNFVQSIFQAIHANQGKWPKREMKKFAKLPMQNPPIA